MPIAMRPRTTHRTPNTAGDPVQPLGCGYHIASAGKPWPVRAREAPPAPRYTAAAALSAKSSVSRSPVIVNGFATKFSPSRSASSALVKSAENPLQ